MGLSALVCPSLFLLRNLQKNPTLASELVTSSFVENASISYSDGDLMITDASGVMAIAEAAR